MQGLVRVSLTVIYRLKNHKYMELDSKRDLDGAVKPEKGDEGSYPNQWDKS